MQHAWPHAVAWDKGVCAALMHCDGKAANFDLMYVNHGMGKGAGELGGWVHAWDVNADMSDDTQVLGAR